MKFGKTAAIETVDFQMQDDPTVNQQVLTAPSGPKEKLHFYIGCTGWSMKEWIGKVYPSGTKTKDFLYHYTRQFNTIELNTTHYRIPTLSTIDKWYGESAPDFKFCPKVPQTISHSRDLGLGGEQIPMFCRSIAGLKEKLGCCFMQLPPYFDYQRLPLLETFLQRFSQKIPLAIEIRHESWFQSRDHLHHLLSTLHHHHRHAVLTDVAGRRDVLHMGLSSNTAMIRFVGNNLHPTDYQRIDAWIERLTQWHSQGLKQVYFFTHEPDNIKAPELADYLSEQLKPLSFVNSRGPKLIESPGKQMQLF